jgi:sugar phosphate permease
MMRQKDLGLWRAYRWTEVGGIVTEIGAGLASLGFEPGEVASVLVGIGLGVVVSGALRSIAIDEAPPALRGSAQGLINIFNAVGTLLAVTCISAIADFEGGGLTGFSHAYLALGLSMLVMLVVAFGLKRKSTDSVTKPASSVGT